MHRTRRGALSPCRTNCARLLERHGTHTHNTHDSPRVMCARVQLRDQRAWLFAVQACSASRAVIATVGLGDLMS